MKLSVSIPLGTLLLALGFATPARAAVLTGQPTGPILAAGDRRVLILSPAGEVLWEYPAKLTHDAWMLPNGNVLFADGETVTEVTREKKVVFQYRAEQQKGGATYACQRLENGRTVVGENSTGRILELDAAGKVVFTLQTRPFEAGQHQNMRLARKLANGHYLVCHSGARLVKEYAPDAKVVWEVKVPGALAFAALRTTNNTTLVSCLDRVIEYNAAGQAVWECPAADLPGGPVRNLTGMHLLPNGHLALGCYRAYVDGLGSALLEISRDKQVVWRYANPAADSTMMAVELLSPEGKALPGEALR